MRGVLGISWLALLASQIIPCLSYPRCLSPVAQHDNSGLQWTITSFHYEDLTDYHAEAEEDLALVEFKAKLAVTNSTVTCTQRGRRLYYLTKTCNYLAEEPWHE